MLDHQLLSSTHTNKHKQLLFLLVISQFRKKIYRGIKVLVTNHTGRNIGWPGNENPKMETIATSNCREGMGTQITDMGSIQIKSTQIRKKEKKGINTQNKKTNCERGSKQKHTNTRERKGRGHRTWWKPSSFVRGTPSSAMQACIRSSEPYNPGYLCMHLSCILSRALANG